MKNQLINTHVTGSTVDVISRLKKRLEHYDGIGSIEDDEFVELLFEICKMLGKEEMKSVTKQVLQKHKDQILLEIDAPRNIPDQEYFRLVDAFIADTCMRSWVNKLMTFLGALNRKNLLKHIKSSGQLEDAVNELVEDRKGLKGKSIPVERFKDKILGEFIQYSLSRQPLGLVFSKRAILVISMLFCLFIGTAYGERGANKELKEGESIAIVQAETRSSPRVLQDRESKLMAHYEAIAKAHPGKIVQRLVRDLVGTNDEVVKKVAATKLGRMRSEAKAAIPALVKLLSRDDYLDRYCAVWAISMVNRGEESAIDALKRALFDEFPGVARVAAMGLGVMGAKAKGAVSSLNERKNDENIGFIAKMAIDSIENLSEQNSLSLRNRLERAEPLSVFSRPLFRHREPGTMCMCSSEVC